MASETVERKLAAIVAADVVGYSRLMSADETGTLTRLTALRQDHIEPKISAYGGRIVKLMGDGILVEFPSVVDALACAVEVQRAIAEANKESAENQRIQFRMGIHLGDIIVQDGDIYGDGVNIAARLEPLAEPGGICISHAALDAVGQKLPLVYEDIGSQQVKNIDKPVLAYQVRTPAEAVMPKGGYLKNDKPAVRWVKQHRLWVTVAIVAILFIGAVSWLAKQQAPLPAIKTTNGVVDATTVRSEKPSIAVLPFNNMSNDPEQEYFSDGMTEDLITDLSKISDLLVVSRNAVFRYKGKAVEPRDLMNELGVHYVVEGSIRKIENQVRINAQLIDTQSGFHLWAERYDRDLSDIFALQDQLTGHIVDALKVTLSKTEKNLLKQGRANVPEAYDTLLQARKTYVRWTPQSNEQTIALQKKAIELDPQFTLAYTELSYTYFQKWVLEGSTRMEPLEEALEVALRAVDIDEGFAPAHMMVGWMRLWSRQYDVALEPMMRAIELDPNYSEGMARLGEALMFLGNPNEALRYSLMARERVKFEPYAYNFWLGEVYFYLKRYTDAVAELNKAIEGNPNFFPAYRFLAAVYAEMGRLEDAKDQVSKALNINPRLSIGLLRRQLPFQYPDDLERQLTALREAGLPE